MLITALSYANQVGVGKALAASGLRRSQYFITSKIPGGLGEVNSTAAIDTDLEQLGTGYVDLLLAHMPSGSGGKGTPAELRRAMDGMAAEPLADDAWEVMLSECRRDAEIEEGEPIKIDHAVRFFLTE